MSSSSRIWSARQRCQPSNSPAAAKAACAWFSNLSSISLPCSFKAWRKALAALLLALPWPSPTSCSNFNSASRTWLFACSLISGSILGFTGFFGASSTTAKPRNARISSAHTGTGGNAAVGSNSAVCACRKAARNASHTTSNCAFDESSKGANLESTLFQLLSLMISLACSCQCCTSVCKAVSTLTASLNGLVDNTSMRCASKTAASRCT